MVPILQVMEEFGNRFAQDRMAKMGGDLAQGLEDKTPLMEKRMGHTQFSRIYHEVIKEKKVQINDACPPLERTDPTDADFNPQHLT